MIKITLCLLFAVIISTAFAQTPFEKSGYRKLTTHKEITDYLTAVAGANKHFEIEYIGTSSKGREIPAIKLSEGKFGADNSKIKVLLFAQQHGDEPSGKEGALLLVSRFASGELNYLLKKIDLVIVPQMNPDGGEVNRRRNGNGADLNRDHLILMQPENQGLHKFFSKYMFEASMDVHEYSPYSQSWIKFGAIKNSDEQIGRLTNINVSAAIRKYSGEKYIPYIKKYITEKGFSCFDYIPGGVPEADYIRYSTFDINDGRQGFGSLGTFSFIQEGKNGRDSIDNIERRSKGQMTGMLGFLEYLSKNSKEIKALVKKEREKTVKGEPKNVAVQMIHVSDGSTLKAPLLSVATNRDTQIVVKNFRPVVKSLFDVTKPAGYLVPESRLELLVWAERHGLKIEKYVPSKRDIIEEYTITKIDSIDFEGDIVADPSFETKKLSGDNLAGNYMFIPTAQLAGNIIVQALEPKSMIGLVTYKSFEHLLVKNAPFPVLRLIRK